MLTSQRPIKTDSIILFFTALAPILQHYKGIGVNPSLALTVVLAAVALVRLFSKKITLSTGFFLLLLYGAYAAFIHGLNLTYFLREVTQIVIYLAVINGLFDIRILLGYCRRIAVCATVLIIVQYICFYILGFHLQLVAIPLLNPGNSQWFGLIRTGMIGVTGSRLSFYRPSAFFLEPSHFAIFCTPVIVTTLFSDTGDRRKERALALFVTVGVLLSTSGMGIGVVVMCWALYLGFFFGRKGRTRGIRMRNLLSIRSITLIIMFVVVLVLCYFGVPVFRQSVRRIFNIGGTMTISAIQGRTTTGRRSLRMLQGIRLLIGYGDIYDIRNWNMATFYFVTFTYGWIGTVLYYSFYIYSSFKLRREAQIMAIIFLILSFFTVHMFGAYYKMYYTMIMLYGYALQRRERTAEADPGASPANDRSASAVPAQGRLI